MPQTVNNDNVALVMPELALSVMQQAESILGNYERGKNRFKNVRFWVLIINKIQIPSLTIYLFVSCTFEKQAVFIYMLIFKIF